MGRKIRADYANKIRRRTPRLGNKWHLDEAVVSINGKKHFLWRAVDQDGFALEVLVQSRRDTKAAKRLIRKHSASPSTRCRPREESAPGKPRARATK